MVHEFSIEAWPYPCVLRGQAGHTNGSFTLQQTDSGTDSDSDPIPVVDSYDWNLNLTACNMKSSAE